ncbi:MAG: 4Fe-4S binding protein [Verrucomicrobia bacterium]|nr:4Fe-4S binding protein [Verrucomicrobiota bacterium]
MRESTGSNLIGDSGGCGCSSVKRRGMRPMLWLLLLLINIAPLQNAYGVMRFPPPEFESGYQMPTTTTPEARSDFLDYLDIAVLAAALSMAAHLVLWRRSRKWVFVLMLFSLAYFGFYRKGCICSIGSIQNVALAVFDGGYALPLSALMFFLLPLVFALFFGRVFCGAVCPLGAIQDAVLFRPVKVKPWLEHVLATVPFLYLGAAVLFAATGSAFIICEYDPFVAFFRRSGSFGMLTLGVGFLVLGVFVGRPYCRFLCPYGAVLRVLSYFSRWKVELSPNECLQCQICEEACPYGAISEPIVFEEPETPLQRRRSVIQHVIVTLVIGASLAVIGGGLATEFSKVHPTVSLAERVAGEEQGRFEDTTDASAAFRDTGRTTDELYAEAMTIRSEFVTGGRWLGAFFGIVIGLRMMIPAFRQRRSVYDPSPSACLSCGRCYNYCPKELLRVKRNRSLCPKVDSTSPKNSATVK